MSRPAPTPAGRPLPALVRGLNRGLLHRAAKPLLHLLAAAPLAWLVWRAATDGLGANPAEALIRGTGDWTLRGLWATLAITPLRQAFNLSGLARMRRPLGVWTFAYAVLHALCYAWLDMGLYWADIVHDIAKRPFILVGTLALLAMAPLAATSFNAAIRALGAPAWQRLHRSVYAVSLLALLHFFWMRAGKNDFGEWGIYAAVLAVLLGWRALRWLSPPASGSLPRRPGAA